jgi:WD40 repeat protein
MRKQLDDELEYFMNISDKPNAKLSRKVLSKLEGKENYVATCNQFSHIYMRYVELQESNKMSSKHNTSKNLLFNNLPNSTSSQAGNFFSKMNLNYHNKSINFFSSTNLINHTSEIARNQSQNILSNLINFSHHFQKGPDVKYSDTHSKIKFGINSLNESEINNINKEILIQEDHNFQLSLNNINNFIVNSSSGCSNQVSNTNSNLLPIREIEEEQELKKKIKEIASKRNVKGLTSIFINRENRRILVNSMANTQYIYDCLYWDKLPPIELKGHKSSFCVKSVLSPDSNYVLSGSSDANIYLWNIKKGFTQPCQTTRENEPLKLSGFHSLEVGAVDWGRNSEHFIASACDNGIVLIWDDK